MEVADPKWRTHIGIVLFLPWALGLMAWGGFAYLVREWRMLQLTVSLLCLAFLPTLWFMDESPRWLAVRGQHRRALRVLQRAARWNGVALPPRTSFCSCSRTETPRLRTITLSLYTNYLLVGAVYFGLSLSGGDLSSDPFLYMVLTGVVELPAYTLVIPLVARYGRRAPVVAFFFMGAVALLALPFVPTGSGESMTLALMGKMSIASAFQILDFYSSELFPTECSGGVGARGTGHARPAGDAARASPGHHRTPGGAGDQDQRVPATPCPRSQNPYHLRQPSGLGDSTPRGFHSKGIPRDSTPGIPLLGDSTRGFQRGFQGDSTRGFHS
ncbi:putative organic cation transporter protein-like [Penaeus vannamei]|uniref:Putative organic cation transporter protein-like n=1 Tax=Penaeus vannamei TaxID=6689 RepID=A0A423TEL9_PENVA|nr:putative organic cation transporter protein-like [Penaeus vannamei]